MICGKVGARHAGDDDIGQRLKPCARLMSISWASGIFEAERPEFIKGEYPSAVIRHHDCQRSPDHLAAIKNRHRFTCERERLRMCGAGFER